VEITAGFSIAVSSEILLFSISAIISAEIRDKRVQVYNKNRTPIPPLFTEDYKYPSAQKNVL